MRKVPSAIRLSSFEPLLNEGNMVPNSLRRKVSELIEKYAILRSDGVFSPSHLLANVVEEQLNIPVSVVEPPYIHKSDFFDENVYRDLLNNRQYLLFLVL